MLYHLVRPVARYVLGYYFRHIDITGLENIPRDRAVILAANHPTAFLEPCLLACFQRRPLHFLARGDLYKNRLTATLLRALNILPVYRAQDGTYSDLSRNYLTFEECFKVLSKQKALMILAEGRCIHEKRLRPLRKGTARIALGALDRDTTLPEVYIVPVGVNFTAADRVRSRVMISCGKPLRAGDYLTDYRRNEASGLRALTTALHDALKPLVVQLPERAEDDLYETMLEVGSNRISPETGLTHTGNQLEEALKVSRSPLPNREAVARYAARLRTNRVTDAALARKNEVKPSTWKLILAGILVVPQLPLWVLAELLAGSLVREVEFYSPVRFAFIAVGKLLYLPLLFIIPWPIVVYLLLSVCLIHWSMRQLETYLTWRAGKKVDRLVPAERTILEELRRSLLD